MNHQSYVIVMPPTIGKSTALRPEVWRALRRAQVSAVARQVRARLAALVTGSVVQGLHIHNSTTPRRA